jgi:ribosomal protein L34
LISTREVVICRFNTRKKRLVGFRECGILRRMRSPNGRHGVSPRGVRAVVVQISPPLSSKVNGAKNSRLTPNREAK